MVRVLVALVFVWVSVLPASADHDRSHQQWDDGYYGYSDRYERRPQRQVRPRSRYEAPGNEPFIYVPYGSYYSHYFDNDPPYPVERRGDVFDPRKDCEIERKWKRGRLIEDVDCDD